jgi:sugar lactone lactonase YvrE
VSPTGQVNELTNSCNGKKMLFIDDLDLTPDSTIIFSEASRKFSNKVFLLDLLEHRPNGNVFRYDLKTGRTEQLLDKILSYPFVRKLIMRLSQAPQKDQPHGFVLGFDKLNPEN